MPHSIKLDPLEVENATRDKFNERSTGPGSDEWENHNFGLFILP